MSEEHLREVMKWKNKYREVKRQLDQTQGTLQEVEGVIAQLDEQYKAQQAQFEAANQPDDRDEQIAELYGQIIQRDRRDEWKNVVGNQIHQQAPIEELWAKAGYQPTEEPLTPEQIGEYLGRARDAAPYLFTGGNDAPGATAPQAPSYSRAGGGATAPRPAVGTGGGTGAIDRTGMKVSITREQLQTDPKILHRPEVQEARKNGSLVILE